MNKQELTRAIKKNAKEQIKIYQREVKEWSDEEMKLKFKGAIQGIREFIKNLQALNIIS